MRRTISTTLAAVTNDVELLFENSCFPLTKAEIIHKARTSGVPLDLQFLLLRIPSRFYESKKELISQIVVRNALKI